MKLTAWMLSAIKNVLVSSATLYWSLVDASSYTIVSNEISYDVRTDATYTY